MCLGRCATVADPSSLEPSRRACDLDECKATGAVQICPLNYTCTARVDNPDKGECTPSSQPFCDPTAPRGTGQHRCPDNLVCVPLGSEAEVGAQLACGVFPRALVRRDGTTLVPRGRCAAPRLDTEACDGDWDEAVLTNGSSTRARAVCAPCADGLRCWQGRCRRGCLVDGSGAPVADFSPATPPTFLPNMLRCRASSDANSSYRCSLYDRVTSLPEPTTLRNGLCERCANSGSSCPVAPGVEVEGRIAIQTQVVPAGIAEVSFAQAVQTGVSVGVPRSPCCLARDVCAGPNAATLRCCTPIGGVCASAAQCCAATLTVARVSTVVAAQCGPTPTSGGASVCRPPAVCGMTSDCSQIFGRQDCFITGPIGVCAPCGSNGSACCPTGPRCDALSQCSGTQCTACGGLNEPCCGGTTCRGGNTCNAGVCRVACGLPGQPCCPGGACTGLNACSPTNNTCAPCGTQGIQCCPTATGPFCAMGLGCDPRGDQITCQPCGGSNQVCCNSGSGFTCNSPSLACNPTGTPVCQPCGRENQLCCTSGAPCSNGNACESDGRCGGPCGGSGERCCLPGFTCRNGICDGGVCP